MTSWHFSFFVWYLLLYLGIGYGVVVKRWSSKHEVAGSNPLYGVAKGPSLGMSVKTDPTDDDFGCFLCVGEIPLDPV